MNFLRFFRTIVPLCLLASAAHAQSDAPFEDTFDGTSLGSAWNAYDNTWFIQRTQFGLRPEVRQEGGVSFARLPLQTFNDGGNANYPVKGTEMFSRRMFYPVTNGGWEFETRMRGQNLPPGIVWAFFAYGERGTWPDKLKTEVDFELLTNQSRDKLWLNIFNDFDIADGQGENRATNDPIGGLNWANWNTYTVRWYSDRVEWRVNGGLVRTEANIHPNDPMALRFNIWAAGTWGTAADVNLTNSRATYWFDVDYARARRIDNSGNVLDVAPDTSAPQIALTIPNNTWSYRAVPEVRGTSSDNTVVKAVTIRLQRASDGLFWNGSGWAEGEPELPTNGQETWAWKLPAVADGKYFVRATARDEAGNIGRAQSEFWLDSTPPVASFGAPRSNTWYSRPARISGTASDPNGPGVASVAGQLYRYDSQQWWNGGAWVTSEAEAPASGTTSWSLTLPALPDGRYAFRAVPRDYIGNVGRSATVAFYVDSTAPVVTISTPQNNVTVSTLSGVAGTSSDPKVNGFASGLARLTLRLYRWDGKAYLPLTDETSATGSFASWNWALPANLPRGVYGVQARARDKAGNETLSAPIRFTKN